MLWHLPHLTCVCQNECGPEATKLFLDSCQRLVNFWMLHHGYTIGLGDTIADVAVVRNIQQIIDRAKLEVQGLIETCRKGEMKVSGGGWRCVSQSSLTAAASSHAQIGQARHELAGDAGDEGQ